MMGKRAEKKLEEVRKCLGGALRISKRKVPYLLLPGDRYSVCYFGKNNFFRTFSGFGTEDNQKYMDFDQAADLVHHFSRVLGFGRLPESSTPMKILKQTVLFLLITFIPAIDGVATERDAVQKEEGVITYSETYSECKKRVRGNIKKLKKAGKIYKPSEELREIQIQCVEWRE